MPFFAPLKVPAYSMYLMVSHHNRVGTENCNFLRANYNPVVLAIEGY